MLQISLNNLFGFFQIKLNQIQIGFCLSTGHGQTHPLHEADQHETDNAEAQNQMQMMMQLADI